MSEAEEMANEVHRHLDEWIATRQSTIIAIQDIAKDLRAVRKDVHFFRILGGFITSTCGTLTLITGKCLLIHIKMKGDGCCNYCRWPLYNSHA